MRRASPVLLLVLGGLGLAAAGRAGASSSPPAPGELAPGPRVGWPHQLTASQRVTLDAIRRATGAAGLGSEWAIALSANAWHESHFDAAARGAAGERGAHQLLFTGSGLGALAQRAGVLVSPAQADDPLLATQAVIWGARQDPEVAPRLRSPGDPGELAALLSRRVYRPAGGESQAERRAATARAAASLTVGLGGLA